MTKATVYGDKELIQAIKNPHIDDAIIKYFYKNYFADASNYIRMNQGSTQDAEDIFQEVIVNFIEIVRNDKFRGDSAVKTFLYSLTRFTWLNELKKRARTLVREENYHKASDLEEKDISHFVTGREARATVNHIIDSLGEVCKKILMAFYFSELSFKEILPLVGYQNEQVLRNKKYKCLKSLEQEFAANPELARQFKNALMNGH